MKVYNRYNSKPITDGLDFTGHEEVCNQQLAEECEVRTIMEQYNSGLIQDLPAVRQPVYNSEFITPQSYEQAKAMVDQVKQDFFNLPPETQRKFGNIETYLTDMFKISQGDNLTMQKYQGCNIASDEFGKNAVSSATQPVADVDLADASGSSSSSISRSDTKTSSEV